MWKTTACNNCITNFFLNSCAKIEDTVDSQQQYMKTCFFLFFKCYISSRGTQEVLMNGLAMPLDKSCPSILILLVRLLIW